MDDPKFQTQMYKYKCLIDALDNNEYTYNPAPFHTHGGLKIMDKYFHNSVDAV